MNFKILSIIVLLAGFLQAAEKTDAPKDPNSLNQLAEKPAEPGPNETFSKVLKPSFVNSKGEVDYAKVRRQKNDILDVLRWMRRLEVEDFLVWEDEQKAAFWINAYNICVIKTVFDHYPIEASRIKMIFYPAESIMQIDDPFTDKYYAVMGNEYNLSDMEKNAVDVYGDPKVLLALSQAAVSSPKLRNEPYTGWKLEKMLDEQVKQTLLRDDFVDPDHKAKELAVSRLFKEKSEYFHEHYFTRTRLKTRDESIRGVLNFIFTHKPDANWIVYKNPEFDVKYSYFDWRLNDAKISD
ncbi:DUF547 domain-containing protein [Sedimentisphaera salicampi]|uniref:DUF547 domain-containing protein n=1 Tax=Sedimentisphaera salicampi TaxID=1941349 RepID=A0A1W6LN45_9BACT|nr:DUF547 domain-containing protein [Sedimentisphaera salicampi]ARN57205.1 hypothetical protein STSP1_01603 [Sedimentisphaera salicampi]OXU14712.1 hypothetical protein SMSP1_01532 [Sedimentisphaera salicampi]